MASQDVHFLLSKIVRGLEKSRFVLVEHTVDADAVSLLNCFLRSNKIAASRTLLLLENQRKEFSTADSDVVVEYSSSCISSDGVGLCERLLEFAASRTTVVNSCLVIDSLNPLVLCHSERDVCVSLDKLLEKFELVVAAVSSEIINDHNSQLFLERLASTVINLKYNYNQKCQSANVIHKKRSRKLGFNVLIGHEENFKTIENGIVNVESENQNKKAMVTQQSTTSDPVDLAGLTFSLTLNDEEKKAREKVALPYVKQTTESKVIYYPDKNDDIDEDDPDDDLDI